MFSTLLCLGAVVLVLFGVIVAFGVMAQRYEDRRKYHRPIVCMCEVNGRIGVVLRRDYNKASRRYWKPYYDAEKIYDAGYISAPDGFRIEVSPIFVFKAYSQEYYTLAYSCYVERAIFDVPLISKGELNPIAKAYQYFHGKPWKGDLINW